MCRFLSCFFPRDVALWRVTRRQIKEERVKESKQPHWWPPSLSYDAFSYAMKLSIILNEVRTISRAFCMNCNTGVRHEQSQSLTLDWPKLQASASWMVAPPSFLSARRMTVEIWLTPAQQLVSLCRETITICKLWNSSVRVLDRKCSVEVNLGPARCCCSSLPPSALNLRRCAGGREPFQKMI